MNNKIIKIFLSLLIMAQSMIFQLSAPQLVLCIAGEDHVAIEVSKVRHSGNDTHSIDAVFAESASLHRSFENSCIDIPLDYHFGNSHISNKKTYDKLSVKQNYYFVNQFNTYILSNSILTENIFSVTQHIEITVLLI